ncbi:MAG: hypothetical protein ACFUZC_22995 [Chthoniobacteraceae bacterium]
MANLSATQQIEQLEAQIRGLRQQALAELQEKLAEARRTVAELEKQLAEVTGNATEAAAAPVRRRTRRPSVTNEQLKPLVLKAMAEKGLNGLNAKDIAEFVGQDPMRVRKFIAENPSLLKRQGAGPGTRFFLK